MIRIQLKKTHEFHSEWEELNQDEALKLFELLDNLEANKKTLLDVQVELFLQIAGLKLPKGKIKGHFGENVYQVAKMLTFFYKYKYLDDRFEQLDPELQKKLEKYLPEELEQTPEVRIASKFKYGYAIDAVFGKNLIHRLPINHKLYASYVFANESEYIFTSLTTTQYLEALSVASKYAKSKHVSHLNLLASILYQKGTYNSELAFQQRSDFGQLPLSIKKAIWQNFMAICAWISTQTHFSILWAKAASSDSEETKKNTKKTESTIGNMVYIISKAGYGDAETVGRFNLMKSLEILKEILQNNIRSMIDAKIEFTEISKKTGLSIETITQLK